MSMKFQVTLPEGLLVELKRAAAEQGVSVAEFIRETVQERLRRQTTDKKGDPFAAITGLVDSDERDLASRVDDVLYR